MNKPIPKFKNEEEERAFWSEHHSSEYLNWQSAERVLFPNLKPSTRAISLRLPEPLLAALRQMANELEEGALLTIDPARTRLRVLPLQSRG